MNRALEIFVFYLRLFGILLWTVIASILAMPLAFFRWKDAENNYLFGKIYGIPARAIMGIRVRVEGAEHLEVRPAIFTANHQSGLDLAAMTNVYPLGAVVIGKKELRRIPGFGIMFAAFGNVLIDRQDRKNALTGLNQAVATMKQKNLSVWIFPEGTRNPSGEGLLPFKKGAFYMAIQMQSPIVPIICSRLERLVSFREKYARSGELLIRVLPPISTVGMNNGDVDRLLSETREKMLLAVSDVNARMEPSEKSG